jgi:hypothetical protein
MMELHLPSEAPPRRLFRERRSILRAPFIHLSKSPVDDPSSRFPKWGPYGKRCRSPDPLYIYIYISFRVPQQGSPPSRFPSQSSQRDRHSTSVVPFNYISNEPPPCTPTGFLWREKLHLQSQWIILSFTTYSRI